MFLRADIDLVPGAERVLDRCMGEFLVPAALESGWQLVASLQENDNRNKIVNIWNVGDQNSFAAGLDLMRSHAEYEKYKQLLEECIVHETHTLCDNWRS